MPSIDRDSSASRDSDRRLKHQHSSSSDHGRAVVPMWDSSDPDRAPPPLPLNPASSPSLTSRTNTSSAIQSAHAALTEKARENAHALIPNPSPKRHESPERSLIKGATHKRMQSLQTGNVRDLSNFIESGSLSTSPSKSPERTANRPSTPFTNKELIVETKPVEKDTSHSTTPTSNTAPSGRDTPTVRPSLRRPPQSILGENTPPQSATMLALQSMSARDAESPLSNVTNGSTALVRTPQTFDAISNQILSLTSIATSLQREMAQLSRRSKDNATDLISLKEATNTRDEDIRKSLRELVASLSESGSRSSSTYGNGAFMLDSKAHTPSSRTAKTFILPRIPSPTSFSASLDRESTVSPRPYNIEGAASIALLEKILREMGTQEGQEMLLSRLAEVADRVAKDGAATGKKLEELLQFIKNNSNSGLLVSRAGGSNGNGNGRTRNRNFSFGEVPKLELDFDHNQSGPMVTRVENLLDSARNKDNMDGSNLPRTADIINEDILKVIRSVKDSVAQGGGLTAEVKALVRELRGEVLGMGREIGRKLDHANANNSSSEDAAAESERITRVVQDGLEDLKQHMDRVMREARRQSSSSSISRTTVDGREVYDAVKSALVNLQSTLHPESQEPSVSKEDIIEAVREAWESYKPEIEVQHFGLERDELLACLKEGIQEYTSHQNPRSPAGATREEVFTAVVEGLKHFSPPRVDTEASLSREEILDAVRECLEEFEFPSAPSVVPRDAEITKDDMVDAVREGLSTFDFPIHTTALGREVGGSITGDDVYNAVRAGLESRSESLDGYSQQVLARLQDIIETMREEFKAVSDEAKQNVAAHGRDTEQVLDATKDGLENLRADIESYIDRATEITGRHEMIDSMRESFDCLRAEVEVLVTRGSESSLEGVRAEIDNLRETMATSMVRGSTSTDNDAVIRALKESLDGLRADIERPRGSNESILSGTGEILDALHDGLAGLRAEVEKIGSKPVDMTVNYEILDTLKDGLESVRADIDRLRESSNGEREVAAITDGAVITAEGLKRNDIENLEVLITQLRIKVEALESMPPPPPPPQAVPDALSRDDLANVEETLRNVQISVDEISGRERSMDGDAVRKEDVEAIETLLRNTKAKIDDMDPEQTIKKDQFDAVDEIVRETRDAISEIVSRLNETSKREDVSAIEALLKDVVFGLEEIKERVANDNDDAEKVTKTDIEAVEAACLDIKAQIEQMVMTDLAALVSKDDAKNLEELVKDLKGRTELHAESDAKAFEERQAEIVGVGERVSEIKAFLEDFRDAVKEKLDEGSTGIEALGKFLEGLGDTINQNANVTDDVRELFETMKTEFEKSNAGVVGAKLETDENFQKTWDRFDEKFDEKFGEIMKKYDDVKSLVKSNAEAGEEKIAETESTMLATKTVIEELKILVDTLGVTLTDYVEKTDEASNAVFNRVEDTFSRVEATHADTKTEHQLTHEQVLKTLAAVEGVQEQVTEYHPKILDSIKDILSIVGQHYEHSRTSVDSIQEKIAEKASLSQILDQPLLREAPAEKYDDAPVHEKLDKLVDHIDAAKKSFTQLEMLDQIHQQVMQTAAEVSRFVSTQNQRIANDHEEREKAVDAATIALEKQLTQKELVESEVIGLQEEKDHLEESVSVLKAENEDLIHQKMRLAADVSSLETALRIRREELHDMEARAERLERRILDGVIDHSRALLMTRSNKGTDAMSLKRVPSQATFNIGSTGTLKSRVNNTTQNAVSMAMGGNRAVTSQQISNSTSTARRILSLNQITHNVPTGGFKRSHSVKTPGSGSTLRKSSWGGSLNRKEYGDLNKENLALKESDEDGDNISDAGTMRRNSIGGTSGFGTGTEMTESIEEGTEYSDEEMLETLVDEKGHMVLYGESSQDD